MNLWLEAMMEDCELLCAEIPVGILGEYVGILFLKIFVADYDIFRI